MLNAILTGHGDFSIGLKHAMEMIAGPQENLVAIPFYENEPLEAYQDRLASEIEDRTLQGAELLILTDLIGGTPFNTAMMKSYGKSGVEVVSGTNLPMLIELVGELLMGTSAADAADAVVVAAKSGVVIGKLEEKVINDEEDGI